MTPAGGRSLTEDAVEQALRGEGPLFAAMLAERARELAAPPAAETVATVMLLLRGMVGCWALPVAEAARVEPLGPCTVLPSQAAAVLGLAMVAGRRCLVIDLDAALAATPLRPPDRPGHVVLLRYHPVALAVERGEDVRPLPPPPAGSRVLADGSVLVDVGAVMGGAVTALSHQGGRP